QHADWHIRQPGELLRRRDGFPGRPVQRAFPLLGDHENHDKTLASSRRRRTSSFAASAADPPMICVFFAFSGTYRLTICCLGGTAPEGSEGGATLRISFFFAAMIPFSVA